MKKKKDRHYENESMVLAVGSQYVCERKRDSACVRLCVCVCVHILIQQSMVLAVGYMCARMCLCERARVCMYLFMYVSYTYMYMQACPCRHTYKKLDSYMYKLIREAFETEK